MINAKKKIVYVDLDDTSANFFRSARTGVGFLVDEGRMYEKDFFFNLEPVPGAKAAIRRIMRMGFDVWFLSQPLADCFESYTDKAKWVGLHFPELANKIILTQDKGLHFGHYLIDDNEEKWKPRFEANGGKFITYPFKRGESNSHEKEWDLIVKFFNDEEPTYIVKT